MTYVKINPQPRQARILDINGLYAPTHLALKLGISRKTLYKRMGNGEIPLKHIHDVNGTTMIYYVEKYY